MSWKQAQKKVNNCSEKIENKKYINIWVTFLSKIKIVCVLAQAKMSQSALLVERKTWFLSQIIQG